LQKYVRGIKTPLGAQNEWGMKTQMEDRKRKGAFKKECNWTCNHRRCEHRLVAQALVGAQDDTGSPGRRSPTTPPPGGPAHCAELTVISFLARFFLAPQIRFDFSPSKNLVGSVLSSRNGPRCDQIDKNSDREWPALGRIVDSLSEDVRLDRFPIALQELRDLRDRLAILVPSLRERDLTW